MLSASNHTDGIAVTPTGEAALLEMKLSLSQYKGRRTVPALTSLLATASVETAEYVIDEWTTQSIGSVIPARHAYQVLAAATAASCNTCAYGVLEAASRRLHIVMVTVTPHARQLFRDNVASVLTAAHDLSASSLQQHQALLTGSQHVATRHSRLQWAAITTSQRLVTSAAVCLNSLVKQYKAQAQSAANHVAWKLEKGDNYPSTAMVLVSAMCASRLHKGVFQESLATQLRILCGLTARPRAGSKWEELKYFGTNYRRHIQQHIPTALPILEKAAQLPRVGKVWGTALQRAADTKVTSEAQPQAVEQSLADHACDVQYTQFDTQFDALQLPHAHLLMVSRPPRV